MSPIAIIAGKPQQDTSMKIRRHLLLPLLALSCSAPLLAQDDDDLFPEGAFEMADSNGLPEGWAVPDKNDRPWQAGSVVTLEEEEGGHFARITTVPEHPGFFALGAAVPIPEGKTTIRVSARLRAEMEAVPGDWTGYKLHVGFATEAGSGPGSRGFTITNDKAVFNIQKQTPDWTEMEANVEVPPGAKFVCINVIVGAMLGTFDIDDVKVYAE